MKKVWESKDGSKTRKITLTIEKTTLEDKLRFLGSVVIVAFVYYFFFRGSIIYRVDGENPPTLF